MDINTILEISWVPIIVFGISLGYGIVLLSTKNPKILIGKKNGGKIIRDREKYAVEGGKLLLFLAVGSLLMSVLLFFNVAFATLEIIIWLVLFAVMWKKISDLYGPVN